MGEKMKPSAEAATGSPDEERNELETKAQNAETASQQAQGRAANDVEGMCSVTLSGNKEATIFLNVDQKECFTNAQKAAGGFIPKQFEGVLPHSVNNKTTNPVPTWVKNTMQPYSGTPSMMNPNITTRIETAPDASKYTIQGDPNNQNYMNQYVQTLPISDDRKAILQRGISDIGKTDAQTAPAYFSSIGKQYADIPECAIGASCFSQMAQDPSCHMNTAASWECTKGRNGTNNPTPGDLVYFDRPTNKGMKGHIAYFVGYYQGKPMMLSVNTSDGAGPQVQSIDDASAGGLFNPRYFKLEKASDSIDSRNSKPRSQKEIARLQKSGLLDKNGNMTFQE